VSCTDSTPCPSCAFDQAFLRSKRPPAVSSRSELRLADLFCGCGGMSVGLHHAAVTAGKRMHVRLAVDFDERVLDIYRRNFPDANARAADISTIFDGVLGRVPTRAEQALANTVGELHILMGGPPCQGHSDLNNHTRRNDPKNWLYLSMARAAEVLKPFIVVVENVPAVAHDKSGVVNLTIDVLRSAGYSVDARPIDFGSVGVPQRRRRFLLLASRVPSIDPEAILSTLAGLLPDHRYRNVRWAISDLVKTENATTFDTPSTPNPVNRERMNFLFEHDLYDLPNSERPECHRDGDHSYTSVYGRLNWREPAQTITTGFGCMGQGRYVHPACIRTLTPHEAARLQTFPDWFDFGSQTKRGILAKSIGNAVPPLLMAKLGDLLLASWR
jgi:DNA (cytosine-5)-methyltransferase 1